MSSETPTSSQQDEVVDDDVSLAPVHDFVGKLKQPGMLPRITDYVEWQKARRAAKAAGEPEPLMPEWAPLCSNTGDFPRLLPNQ